MGDVRNALVVYQVSDSPKYVVGLVNSPLLNRSANALLLSSLLIEVDYYVFVYRSVLAYYNSTCL